MTYPEHVHFWVDGSPAPQGSKRHVGKGRMIEASKGHKAWRAAVHYRVREMAERTRQFEDGPLTLRVEFHIPHGKQRENTPWRRLDLDKLVRAVGDALKTGGLIVDDSRITTIHASKVWAIDKPGAHITISRGENA